VPRTNQSYLRWQFSRWAKNYAANVTMLEPQDAWEVDLHPGEHLIAAISPAPGGPTLIVTDRRLRRAGTTLVWHKEVRHCEWIAPYSALVDLDHEAAEEMKRLHYDRLIFEMRGGRKVMLEGLSQAVFPLLKFYWFKLGRERRAYPPRRQIGIVSFARRLFRCRRRAITGRPL
jgi:hypothetical protein